ncbi:MAG TPA: fatty acyl-AMP ligase [Cellvibrio sp.]
MSLPLDSAQTILTCLEHYAAARGSENAYVFLTDGETQEQPLTYNELRERAQSLAGELTQRGLQDQAVLLLFPAGLDFVIAFFACLYAGTIAVPANLARNSHHYARLKQIIQDSNTQAVLTTPALKPATEKGLTAAGVDLSLVNILCEVDIVRENSLSYFQPAVRTYQPAFIQYTSGSTGNPKGVIVTHSQLVANERAIQRCANLPEFANVGGWLPQFHDMGLIGTMLQPAALGGCYYFMSPLHFIQSPMRWIKLLSRCKAAATAAPNFALEMCVKAMRNGFDGELDLSPLNTMFCGAEPVNQATLAQFNSCFAPYGLHPDAVKPCYGMAETTLIISGGIAPNVSRYLTVNREALKTRSVSVVAEHDPESQDIVCCGSPVDGHVIKIVDPETFEVLDENAVGEIWCAGPSIAAGYWKNARATLETFGAKTVCGQGPFLRTGDLGFINRDGIFVTGRIKELMIIRGKNHYPHDIEATIVDVFVERGMDVQVAVFADDEAAKVPGIVAYIELPRRGGALDVDAFKQLAATLRQAVNAVHDVQLKEVFALKFGSLPRTSSGKTQRLACAGLYTSGEIDADDRVVLSTRRASTAATVPEAVAS